MRLKQIAKKTLFSVFFIFNVFSHVALSASKSCADRSLIHAPGVSSDLVDFIPDGDTIHTKNGSRIRLLNIDTPELNPTNNKPAEPFAKEAKDNLIKLVGKSKKIYWITDNRKTDRYGRILAHVFNHRGELLSDLQLNAGLASVLVIPPNDRFWECLKAIEKEAIEYKKGVWSLDEYLPKSKNKAKKNSDFQWIKGKITDSSQTKNNLWLVLDNKLWVGIPNNRKRFFNAKLLNKKVGEQLSLRGFVYESHGRLRIKLRHPAMLY